MPNEAPVMRAVLRLGIRMVGWMPLTTSKLRSRRKADPETRLNVGNAVQLSSRQRGLSLVDRVPRSRGLQLLIDIIDVLQALSLQPGAERPGTLLCVDRN